MPTQSEPLLATTSLCKQYPEVVALSSLTLSVSPGEVVGLLGPNGAGKTTALRMMAAILTPSSGSATICGFDTCADPMQAKRNLGFLSGDTALYRRLTPREVLRYFGRLHEMSETAITERSDYLIDRLDMTSFADRNCETLSSGQQQKANIARTLLHDPPVMILDEPTNALDIVTGRFILEAISAAREEQKAILFSTHNMGEAEYLCDRLVLLHKGKVQAEGTIQQIYELTGEQNLADAFLCLIKDEEAV